jgi:hypothetical protein
VRKPSLLLILSYLALFSTPGCSETTVETSTTSVSSVPLWGDAPFERPSCVKGIHLTAWITGSKKARARFEKLFEETELNTAVIDIKEIEGDVYIPGITLDGKSVYVSAVKDLKDYLKYLKERGVYTIARIVVFHDNKLAQVKPDWAVRSSSPLPQAVAKGYRSDVWVDRKGSAWADPTNPHVQDYNIAIALKAVELGFQGIQFDYIRFPSDGNTKLCIYSKPHSSAAAVETLTQFLSKAHKKLKPLGVELSIDVFGLTGSYTHDLGIGQKLSRLMENVDVISPMMYPSHYAPGEYGIKDPNNSPYDTVYRSMKDTKKVLQGSQVELRPYLQDFSLGVKYDAKKVRDQIQAVVDQGVDEWLLWNPSCQYTRDALEPFYSQSLAVADTGK